jgi:hypothetical protein
MLVEPNIDDRTYQEILNEVLARIPVHNPEWTNFYPSDPGVTILQLYAFMTESMLYRANQVPERNRIKFLRLLGIPMHPATSARGVVTFSNPRGPLETTTVAAGAEVLAGSVPFRTTSGIDILPVEGRVYYKARPQLSDQERDEVDEIYGRLYGSRREPGTDLAFYETTSFEGSGTTAPLSPAEHTVDGFVWVALMARKAAERPGARDAIAGKVLSLAVVPEITASGRVLPPGGGTEDRSETHLLFDIPAVVSPSEDEHARYATLEASVSGDPYSEAAIIALALPEASEIDTWRDQDPLEPGVAAFPPSLEDEADEERIITWIRIRPDDLDSRQARGFKLRFVGVNATRVIQRAPVSAEFLGDGNGEPDQQFALANTPVVSETVRLSVGGEVWQFIDDLTAAPAEVERGMRITDRPVIRDAARVFSLDAETGVIRFGDGLRGARPPRGAVIQASYEHGGGTEGLVGTGAISKGASLPAGLKVTNPVATWGGDAAESIGEALKRIPSAVRHRDRLVSRDDFDEIVRRVPGIEVGRVEVLPRFHPALPDFAAPGAVTVMVIPRTDLRRPETPEPDGFFLDTLCRYLNPRRLVTTELHVRGPEYVPVYVSVGIDVIPGYDAPPVREAVKQRVRGFLSPLAGGFAGTGWLLDHNVHALELMAVAARVDGVARVNGVLLAGATGSSTGELAINGLQLPRLQRIAVQTGAPRELGELRGDIAEVDAPAIVPVPIVPPEC